jgi:hypothetical protein
MGHNRMMTVAFPMDVRLNSIRRSRASCLDGLPGLAGLAVASALLLGTPAARADSSVYYQCPGNVFTNTISPREAEAKGCKSKEAQQPTSIPAPRARGGANNAAPFNPAAAASRVDAQEQKARDTDSRRILQDELAKAQAQLDILRKDYNNGNPERQGDEKNYQRYIDRTAELKASIARTEADVAAINRELAKTP